MPPQKGNGRNQHLPNPPLWMIEESIALFFFQGKTDQQILDELHDGTHYDVTQYGIGKTKLRAYKEAIGCIGSRKANLQVEDIKPDMERLREIYPWAGAREMASLYLTEVKKKVRRSIVYQYFYLYERELLNNRKNRIPFKTRSFLSAGVNHFWCQDQHDKWKYKFALCLHIAVEPFSGLILWLRVWWNNSNPVLIVNYYLNAIQHFGKMPLLTQSDPGTENNGVANATTMLRHWLDPQLPTDSIQHKWKRKHSNIKPEIEWSQLRRRFSPGFEAILEAGEDIYDMLNYLHVLVFRWVFIPWMQQELDGYRTRVNNKLKRKNKFKLTPHGRPVDIFKNPEKFYARDYGVIVPDEALADARAMFVPEGHPVLDLVPPSFDAVATDAYAAIGRPPVTRYSCWEVYSGVLEEITRRRDEGRIPEDVNATWIAVAKGSQEEDKEKEAGDAFVVGPIQEDQYDDIDEDRVYVDLSDDEMEDGAQWHQPMYLA